MLGPVEPDDVGPLHCRAPASAAPTCCTTDAAAGGVGNHPLSRPAEPPRRREDGGRRIGSQGGPAVRGRQRPAEGLGQEPDGRALRDRGALIGQVQFEQLPGDLEPAPAERREYVGGRCRPCRPRRTGAGGPRRAGPRGPRRARQVRQVRQVHPQTRQRGAGIDRQELGEVPVVSHPTGDLLAVIDHPGHQGTGRRVHARQRVLRGRLAAEPDDQVPLAGLGVLGEDRLEPCELGSGCWSWRTRPAWWVFLVDRAGARGFAYLRPTPPRPRSHVM